MGTPTIEEPAIDYSADLTVAGFEDETAGSSSSCGECEGSTASQGQVAMLISQFEVGVGEPTATGGGNEEGHTLESPTLSGSTEVPPEESPRLEIPLHIRRGGHHQPTKGSDTHNTRTHTHTHYTADAQHTHTQHSCV